MNFVENVEGMTPPPPERNAPDVVVKPPRFVVGKYDIRNPRAYSIRDIVRRSNNVGDENEVKNE